MLVRAAIPVRHDIAPARESGSFKIIGNFCLAEDHIAQTVVAAGMPAFDVRHIDLFALAVKFFVRYISVCASTSHGCRS